MLSRAVMLRDGKRGFENQEQQKRRRYVTCLAPSCRFLIRKPLPCLSYACTRTGLECFDGTICRFVQFNLDFDHV